MPEFINQEKTFEEAYNNVISDVKDEEISNKTKNDDDYDYYENIWNIRLPS